MKKLREQASLFLSGSLMVMGLMVFSSCSNTGKGIKEDYQENKEEVGEEMEDAGDDMQDENNN